MIRCAIITIIITNNPITTIIITMVRHAIITNPVTNIMLPPSSPYNHQHCYHHHIHQSCNLTTQQTSLFLQVNFFQDHTKVILSPCMAAITYINEKRNARTFSFKSMEKHGCGRELAKRMSYALDRVEELRTTLRNHHPTQRDVVKSRPDQLQPIGNKA